MPKGILVGEFEHVVLLAVARLEDNAYGMTVRREIESRTRRDASIGSVYRTLARLEAKGLLDVQPESRSSPVRRGRPRRFFTLTERGRRALLESRKVIDQMWEGVELGQEGGL